MKIDLSGKNILVCGSTQGIGRAIAELCAESGANVTLIARNEKMLAELRGSLNSAVGQRHDYIVADFGDPALVREKVAEHIAAKGGFDILVNNSGGPAPGPALNATPEQFTEAITRHLFVSQTLVQLLVPGMKQASFGRILNIISTSVKQPIPNLGVSNTVRGAMASWSKTLSAELAPFGITVNNILPGATATERLQGIIKNKSAQTGLDEHRVSEEMREEIPAGRFAEPREVAYLACFLASDFASYISGTSIAVDGGRTKCL